MKDQSFHLKKLYQWNRQFVGTSTPWSLYTEGQIYELLNTNLPMGVVSATRLGLGRGLSRPTLCLVRTKYSKGDSRAFYICTAGGKKRELLFCVKVLTRFFCCVPRYIYFYQDKHRIKKGKK